MATIGCTVEQLLIPTNSTAAYIAPMIIVRSPALSLYHKTFKTVKIISQQNDESYFAHKINEMVQIILLEGNRRGPFSSNFPKNCPNH